MQRPLSIDSLTNWRRRLDRPIYNTLLLSLSLHLALLALIQPAPGGGGMETLVIQARLAEPQDKAPEPLPEAPPETVPEVVPDPVEEVKPPIQPAKAPEPLLTSHVPSPAPPLPVAPIPVETVPEPMRTPTPTPQVAATPATEPVKAAPVATIAPVAPSAPAAPNGTSVPIGIGIDTNWYLARQVDVQARAQGSIVPEYPDQARRRNQEGTLKLMVKIDDLGRVRDVEVVEADLPGVFDEAALEAFRNARFHPAMKDGHPKRYQAYIRVVFKLRD
jgi:protein TonB